MEPGDALIAAIEASIALAGFSGLVVVLGRRSQGEWLPQEELRLLNLLGASFQAFLISFLAVLLLSTNLPPSATWVSCSVVWSLATASHTGWVFARRRQLGDADLAKTNPVMFWSIGGLVLVVILLQIANIASIREFWPVLAGIIMNLALGARQFTHLLLSGWR
ncbi:MAG: hypothetical protein CL910_02710 [Deltaproteobacteria bacterium]|jgi:hypothetical protein|nr:hypothetical protein [Deltaproteobacteria bacterium]